MEEQLLLYLKYHPQVAWYGRGDISSTFASTYKIATSLPTPYTIDYLFEEKAHVYLPDAIGQFLDGRLLELAQGAFLSAHDNVLLIGPSGIGKTHLLMGLGRAL